MIEHINVINALGSQIAALLDLIDCCNESCIDVESIKVAADMCATMHVELMAEVEKIENDWRASNDSQGIS